MNEKLIWTANVRKVSELKELERNPRSITEEGFNRLVKRIEDRGFHDVIKLDSDDNILSGNQRSKALVKAGIEEVNTLSPNRALTEAEKKAIIIESNRTDGAFDFDMLASDYTQAELADLGFSPRELDMVDFPELEDFSLDARNEEHENKKYELLFATNEDYKDFLSFMKALKEGYPEKTISDSLLAFLRDNVEAT